jgi:hypothetical protein
MHAEGRRRRGAVTAHNSYQIPTVTPNVNNYTNSMVRGPLKAETGVQFP